jgi:hypothetical protein
MRPPHLPLHYEGRVKREAGCGAGAHVEGSKLKMSFGSSASCSGAESDVRCVYVFGCSGRRRQRARGRWRVAEGKDLQGKA